ncbi:MAG: N-acyl-D-glucosamine 2-epimerase, partial [Bacteroidetes bacterium]|nr:N-acyl-D-glucosamine 2-epimerase [Bacteroidota bacterium]
MSPPFKTIQNQNLESQFARELDEILSWWIKNMPDKNRGGFYGRVAYGEILHPDADKGIVLNTRIL